MEGGAGNGEDTDADALHCANWAALNSAPIRPYKAMVPTSRARASQAGTSGCGQGPVALQLLPMHCHEMPPAVIIPARRTGPVVFAAYV